MMRSLRRLTPRFPALRHVRRAGSALLAAGCLLFAVMEVQVLAQARGDGPEQAACVLVLGAGVRGTEPSPLLKTRLEAALAYLERCPDTPVLLSGGQGPGEQISEAEAMARYLEARGVSREQLWLEEDSRNTEENLRNSARLLLEKGVAPEETVALVSSDFHLCRAKLEARRAGLCPMGVAAHLQGSFSYGMLQVNYFVREGFALAKALLLGGNK